MGAFLFNSLGRVWAGVLDMGVQIATKCAETLLARRRADFGPPAPGTRPHPEAFFHATQRKLIAATPIPLGG